MILNPYAGMRKANRVLTDILAVFNRADYQVDTYITAGAGDATRVAAERAGQNDLVVCCGGDGTFNETVAGILRSGADVPIGYIPAGSTNDFARSLKLPSNMVEVARQIVNGQDHPYDVGLFGDRPFTYVASFGAFTRASYATPQDIKNALGHTAYLLEGISELSQLKPLPVRLEVDDGWEEGEYLFGAVCNSTSVGGILKLDPSQVDMSDGKFEVLLVRAPKDLTELHECILAVQKQTYNCKMITFRSAETIRIHTPQDMVWTLDGERAESASPVEIRNLHKAIRIRK